MKGLKLTIGMVVLLLLFASTAGAKAKDSRFRLGLQSAQFASGISGIMEIVNPLAVQGVVDVGADAVAFRMLYRFHQKPLWNVYGQGTAGIWNTNGYRPWGWRDEDKWHENNNGLGFGAGIGIEYDWRGLSTSLPPIGWNLELGASIVPGFNLDMGIGVHWMF